MDHQLIENEIKTSDGEKKKTSYIEQQIFAIGCTATAEGLTLYPIDLTVHLDTPIAGMTRALSVPSFQGDILRFSYSLTSLCGRSS
jgi:hypothetical protein